MDENRRPINSLPAPSVGAVRARALHFLLSRAVQDSDAQDIAQEVAMKFVRYRERIRAKGMVSWVRTVTLNALHDHIRRGRRFRMEPVDFSEYPGPSGPGRSLYELELERLPHALERLGDRRQDLDPSADKGRRFKARRRLQRMLEVAS